MWLLLTSIIFDGRVLFEVSAATVKKFKLPEIVTENVTLFAESIVLPLWIRSAFWAVASMKMYNMLCVIKSQNTNVISVQIYDPDEDDYLGIRT